MPRSDQSLILFCRYPYGGPVKTRLAQAIGADGTAELYAAILRDTLGWAGVQQPFDLLISLADGYYRDAFSETFGTHPDHVFAQKGNGFGARLVHSFGTAFARGYRRVAVASSDAPELCLEDVFDALAALHEHDIAVVPAPDGGWSLMALRQPVDVFSGVTWSTSVVLKQTMDLAQAGNWRVSLLRPVADIDDVDDLETFRARVFESPELRRRLPHTTRWLSGENTIASPTEGRRRDIAR